jgi:hypothetical protein
MKPSLFAGACAIAAAAFALSGCATITTTGTYILTGTDSAGQPVAPGRVLMAEGSRIYTARNGICLAYPKSIVTIRDVKTGQELKGESPYQCK